MPFPRKLLNDYETVVLDLHPHWWFFGYPAISLTAAMILTVSGLSRFGGLPETLIGYVGLSAIIVCSAWLIVRLIKWRTTYFVVTSHRLIYRQGVVARDGVEIPLERVNNVNFNQSIFERIIGVGDLLIESGGKDGQQTFTDIGQPETVQNIIHSTVSNRNFSHGDPGGRALSVAEELEKLEGLRERGTLTDVEFEEQKRRLLG